MGMLVAVLGLSYAALALGLLVHRVRRMRRANAELQRLLAQHRRG